MYNIEFHGNALHSWSHSLSAPKVLLTHRWPPQVEAELSKNFDVTFNVSDQPLSESELREALQNFDAVCPTVTDKLTAELFLAPELRTRIIANYGVGYNHIDVKAATQKQIAVTNTPDVLTDATADLALTLILMLARRAGEGKRLIRNGDWQGWCPTHNMGTMVSGKTLGLIGMGRIGRAVAHRASFGFGMKILYHNRRQLRPDDLAGLEATYHQNLSDMLPHCDFLSLHCPASPETHQIINQQTLALLPRHAFIINTARGDVIDETALVEALRSKTIAGAGLDVYAHEPKVPEALLSMENVVLLPHLGSATLETRTAMGMRVLDNLKAFFNGDRPADCVN